MGRVSVYDRVNVLSYYDCLDRVMIKDKRNIRGCIADIDVAFNYHRMSCVGVSSSFSVTFHILKGKTFLATIRAFVVVFLQVQI